MLEKELENKLRNEVNKRGGLCWKFVSPGTRGVPDRIVFLSGCTYLVELKKSKDEKLRKMQEVRKLQLETRDIQVWAVKSQNDLDDFLRHVDDRVYIHNLKHRGFKL